MNGVKTNAEQALHKHGVTNRTCVTCLYCQANPSNEFREHFANQIMNIWNIVKFGSGGMDTSDESAALPLHIVTNF